MKMFHRNSRGQRTASACVIIITNNSFLTRCFRMWRSKGWICAILITTVRKWTSRN